MDGEEKNIVENKVIDKNIPKKKGKSKTNSTVKNKKQKKDTSETAVSNLESAPLVKSKKQKKDTSETAVSTLESAPLVKNKKQKKNTSETAVSNLESTSLMKNKKNSHTKKEKVDKSRLEQENEEMTHNKSIFGLTQENIASETKDKIKKKEKIKKQNKTKKCELNELKTDKILKDLTDEVKIKTKNEPYKLKISKNSIKIKNIERLYPNNIGIEETETSYLLIYKNKKAADNDLKKNETVKFYEDKLIISNFSYKENEESIRDFLKETGEVLDVSLEKNKEDCFTGKAVVTFSKPVKIRKELKLNNKILRVERIKKQDVNDKRIFIGRIDMNLSILDIRKAIKSTGAKLTDIRIRFEKDTHKNIGYGHLSFRSREDALTFESAFQEVKEVLGKHAFYEYSKEKDFSTSRK